MRAGATIFAALGLAGGAAAAIAVPHGSPPKPTPVGQAAAPVAPRGRIAVTAAELREAYASGELDRPVRTMLDIRSRLKYGEFRWDDKGVPGGDTWVRVDLKSQIISVFRSGQEIGTAVILYGAASKETPTGKFPIRAKLKEHRSATYDGAPMPYTLRLTDDGVSIHGSNVRWGYATHGCIGVPEAFAAKLFAAVRTGDEVLILSRKRPAKV
jgi:lipoprotein-anchoring transpeptidase ErfK/SrfK